MGERDGEGVPRGEHAEQHTEYYAVSTTAKPTNTQATVAPDAGRAREGPRKRPFRRHLLFVRAPRGTHTGNTHTHTRLEWKYHTRHSMETTAHSQCSGRNSDSAGVANHAPGGR
jgi:hypothetical protein